jgi:hypothetical protein
MMANLPPTDSRCINHRDRKAAGKCSECGAFVCNKCGYYDGKRIICKDCIAQKFGAKVWEKNFAGGGFLGFFKTLWSVLISPTKFFLNITEKGSIASAILFAIICEFLGTLGVILVSDPSENLTLFLGTELTPYADKMLNLSLLLITPLLTIITALLLALIYQGLASLFGGKGNFIPTLKVVAYGSSASLLQIIPFVGGFLSLFYTLILYTKGISQVHKLGGLRAGAVAVLPVMILLLILSILGTVIFTSITGNLSQISGGLSF